MYDDIDWMNASSDCGLAALCREMDALAAPFSSAAALLSRPRARRFIRVRKTPGISSRAGASAPLNA